MTTLLGRPTTVEVDDRRRAVVRALLWVLLVASVLIAFWGTPRTASQDDLARALRAGDVRALQTYDAYYGLEWTAVSIQMRFGSTSSPAMLLWEDRFGMLHRTNLAWLSGGTPGDPGSEVDVLATIERTAQQAGVAPPPVDQGIGRAEYAAVPLGLMTLGFLGLLAFGPQPRRLTKWATLWVICIPLGLGMGWWLARDTPFAPAMNRAVQPYPGEKGLLPNGVRRTGGGVAFLAAWGVSVVVGIWLAVVLGILGGSGTSSIPVETWNLVLAPVAP